MAPLWPDTELGRLHKQVHQLTGRVERLEKILVALSEEKRQPQLKDYRCSWGRNCTNWAMDHSSSDCDPYASDPRYDEPVTSSSDEYTVEDTQTIIRGRD